MEKNGIFKQKIHFSKYISFKLGEEEEGNNSKEIEINGNDEGLNVTGEVG